MKQITIVVILIVSLTTANAQTDSLKIKDSTNIKIRTTAVFQKKTKPLNKKETDLFDISTYKPSEYQNEYRYYRYSEPNSTGKTVFAALGNILLSFAAGRTNHSFISPR